MLRRPDEPTIEHVTMELIDALRAIGVPGPFTFDDPSRSVACGDGRACDVGRLHELYCKASPEKRGGIVTRFASAGFHAIPSTLANAAPLLMPIIRHRLCFELWDITADRRGDGAEVQWWKLGEHLGLSVACEPGGAAIMIQRKNLTTGGTTRDELRSLALRNLEAKSDRAWIELSPGLFASPYQDGYDATRLLLPDEAQRLPVRGCPVALIASENVCLVAGSEDTDALLVANEICEDGGAWRTWMPGDPEVRTHFEVARLRELVADHREQRRILEGLLPDVGIARYEAVADPHGDSWSFSTWVEGRDTLLPRTDRVAFVGVAAEAAEIGTILGMARWDRVEKVLGDRLKDTGYWLPRFRTVGFPTPEECAQLELTLPPDLPGAN